MVTTEDGWKRNNSEKINGLRKKPDKKTVEMDGESLYGEESRDCTAQLRG